MSYKSNGSLSEIYRIANVPDKKKTVFTAALDVLLDGSRYPLTDIVSRLSQAYGLKIKSGDVGSLKSIDKEALKKEVKSEAPDISESIYSEVRNKITGSKILNPLLGRDAVVYSENGSSGNPAVDKYIQNWTEPKKTRELLKKHINE